MSTSRDTAVACVRLRTTRPCPRVTVAGTGTAASETWCSRPPGRRSPSELKPACAAGLPRAAPAHHRARQRGARRPQRRGHLGRTRGFYPGCSAFRLFPFQSHSLSKCCPSTCSVPAAGASDARGSLTRALRGQGDTGNRNPSRWGQPHSVPPLSGASWTSASPLPPRLFWGLCPPCWTPVSSSLLAAVLAPNSSLVPGAAQAPWPPQAGGSLVPLQAARWGRRSPFVQRAQGDTGFYSWNFFLYCSK